MNPRSPTPEDMERVQTQSIEDDSSNLMTEQVADTPFAARRAELEAASFEPVRCKTCGELIPLSPGVVQDYCNKICRKARTKRGQKQVVVNLRKAGLLK